MGNQYSKEWSIASSVFGGSTISYLLVFAICYKRLRRNEKLLPADCKEIGMAIMSSINCVICTVSLVISILFDESVKSWKEEAVTSPPGIAFYLYAQFTAYLLADALVEVVLYLYYRKHAQFAMKLDIAIVFHHIVGYVWMLIQIPRPIHIWFLISIWFGFEISTIPLNAIKLAKYLDSNKGKALRKYGKFGFMLTWFLVRIPILVVTWWWALVHAREMFRVSFVRALLVFGFGSLFTLLNAAWTVAIIKKIIAYFTKSARAAETVHATVMQLGSQRTTTTTTPSTT